MTKLRTTFVAIVGGAAQQYFASFMLVGSTFLLPGHYSFGTVCVIGLLISTASGLVLLTVSSRSEIAAIVLGTLISLVSVATVFELFKDIQKLYFIIGLVVSVPVALVLTAAALKRIRVGALRGRFVQAVMWRAAVMLASIAIIDGAVTALSGAIDASRFVRQQLYVSSAAIVLCSLILVAASLSRAPMVRTT